MAIPGTIRIPTLSSKPSAPPVGSVIFYIKTDNIIYVQDSDGNEFPFASADLITALHGDVTATGPGDAAATVVTVGGASAASIAAAAAAVAIATSNATANTLALRDGAGVFKTSTPTDPAHVTNKGYVDNKVLTIPVAHGIANISGVIQAIFGSTADTVTQGNDARLSVANVVRVKTNPGAGEFSSIAAAMASISGNSSSNPFLITVGPGIYSEPQIVMKPSVSIQGSEQLTTLVLAADPTNDLIVGNTGVIKNLYLGGVTTSGKAAIHMKDVAGASLIIDKCIIQGCDIGVLIEATTTTAITYLYDSQILGSLTTGIKCVSMSSNFSQAYAQNCTIAGSGNTALFSSGTGANIFGSGYIISGISGSDTAVDIRDGSSIRIIGCQIVGFGTGISIPNIGVAPRCTFEATALDLNTQDINILHTGTLGTFNGSSDLTKVFVVPGAPIGMVYVNDGSGTVTVGKIMQGDRHDRLADLSLIAREATTLGLIEDGGALTVISGLQINVAAGEGFLDDPVDDYLKQVIWTATALTLPANSNLFIYIDTNSAVQFNTTSPNIENAVVLGRVVTNSTTVDFIEHSQVNMNHIGNKTQVLLRQGLGSIFGVGATVTENATPLKLDVTAGAYYYGTNTFVISGGTAITWEKIYQDGSGGWVTGSQSTVDHAFYDDGSGTLAPLTAGFFAKHTLYVLGDDGAEKYFLVYSQAQYSAMIDAQNAPLPLVPGFIEDAVVRIAGIVVKQNQSSVNTIIDLRPRLGFAAPSTTVASSHHNLTGLTDGDDHPQYLNRSGVRPMTGPLTSTDATQSVDSSTGSVILAGGLGMAKNLNVGGDASVSGVLSASNFSGSSSGTNTGDVTVTDTDSIDFTLASQNISASLKLSSDAADSGNLKATVSIHSGAGAGLHIEYAFGTPVQIGTSNNIGAGSGFALYDHVHAHGNQTSPTLHALVTSIANGFMSSTDKVKLDASTALNTASTLVLRDSSGNFAAGIITASLTGNVTGNVSGSAASFTGSLVGDVIGTQSATVIAVGAVTDTKSSLANKPSVTVVATTNQALSGLPTIDGQTTTATSIILLTAQSTASQNGPWQANAGAWTRPTWYPSGGTTQAFQFITTLVRLGSTYRGTTWRMTTSGVSTIDTTATTWVVTPIALNPSTIDGSKITATYLNRVVALVDAANIATDASLGNTFTVTLGGNRNLSAPTNPVEGQKIIYKISQDATGNRGLTFDAIFNFGMDIASFIPSVGANKVDYVGCVYNGLTTKWDVVAVSKGF